MTLTRRAIIHSGVLALTFSGSWPRASSLANARGETADQAWRHGLSLFGALKYPAGFAHFDYVDPSAPKGGVARMLAFGTYDSFNSIVAGVKGSLAAGINLIYDTLMVPSLDEASTEYGLLARAVIYPEDHSWVTYRLRADAMWHDGTPVTAGDVIFSFAAFKAHSPQLSAYYRHVASAKQTGEHDVTFTFDRPGNRELPQIVGQLTILPKHWWQGTDNSGKKRDITATTLEPPLGGGAYRIKDFVPGRRIVYERDPHYWGRRLNVNVGHDNFNELHLEYFRDSTIALEAFKADQVDWRTENSAKNWATAYNLPSVDQGRVVLEEFPIRNVGVMQGFAFNTRRRKFKDWRVRLAFNLAFDFEEMNKILFYGQYRRISSYFERTELASSGLPEGEELQILRSVRDGVPRQVFTEPYRNPVGGTPSSARANLRTATRLLAKAGYDVRAMKLVNAKTGEPLTVEFMVQDLGSERFVLFYKPYLKRLGIEVTVRLVDDVQYENRMRRRDFDIVIATWLESLSPGNEQRDYWGSQAAVQDGSRNVVGITNPAVDALIDRVIFAKTRTELVAATRALDRVLLWNHYVVPHWTYPNLRSARWDRFGRPTSLPVYGVSGFPRIWWWDEDKAEAVAARS